MMTFYKLSCQIPSTLDAVDHQVSQLLNDLTQQLDTYDGFTLDLILREALSNAVIHGNHSKPDLVIFFSIMLVGSWFHLSIEDQGTGYDWTSLVSETPRPDDEQGRGLSIILQYGKDVELNHRGNQISFKIARCQ